MLSKARSVEYAFERSFAVQVHRVRHPAEHLSTENLEREIDAAIASQGKKLTTPANVIGNIITDRYHLACLLERIQRGAHDVGRPHLRLAYH